jgi:hypothetical protein
MLDILPACVVCTFGQHSSVTGLPAIECGALPLNSAAINLSFFCFSLGLTGCSFLHQPARKDQLRLFQPNIKLQPCHSFIIACSLLLGRQSCRRPTQRTVIAITPASASQHTHERHSNSQSLYHTQPIHTRLRSLKSHLLHRKVGIFDGNFVRPYITAQNRLERSCG